MSTYFFIFQLLHTLWAKDWHKKLSFIVVLLLTALAIAGNVLTPVLLKYTITLLSDQKHPSLFMIPVLLLSYGGLWTINQLISQARDIILFKTSEDLVCQLSLDIFAHLHTLSLRFHYERRSGQIINNLSRAQSAFAYILWGLLYIIPLVIEISIAACLIFYWYGLFYCLLLLVIVLGCISFNLIMGARISESENNAHAKEADAASYITDSLLNAETVKYFGNQTHEHTEYKKILEARKSTLILENNQRQYIFMGHGIIAGLGLMILSWYAGQSISQGTLSVSDFILMNGYFLQFVAPLISFSFYIKSLKKQISTLQELLKILDLKPEIIDAPHALAFTDSAISIEFKDVSFSYADNLILDSVSFTIPQGKTVAIVGATGAGKSTISRLLYRFYDATTGTILINGHDIKNYSQASLQNAIGIVSQDTLLFNNTIYYNIAYGKLDASQTDVEYAANLAGLSHFIGALPDGYQTTVGERGLKLSGGEKQRIAIARVLLKNPLLYIFDEATASLDTITEKQIQKNFEAIAHGATKLIIAHRLSTVTHADEILVLDKGKIVERGTHATLLNQKSYYHSLWNQSIK
ncbi:MAG: ABC transporter ATP-binding protein [Candidatus Babeliales bacterium]